MIGWILAGCRHQQARTGATGNNMAASEGSSGQVQTASAGAASGSIRVFVPCGMILPFNAVKKEFEKTHPGKQVKIVYNNAVVLVRQILKGDHPDILISPGDKELDTVAEKGLIDESTRTAFGTYKLVMIVPKGNRLGIQKLEDLARPEVKAIAVPDPNLNSVGDYTRQALIKLGVWDMVARKALMPEYPIAALEFVSSKKTDAGFSYLTCPLESAPEKGVTSRTVDVIDVIPENTHDPIGVLAAALKDSRNKELSKEFIDFLLTDPAKQLLAKNGLPNLPEGFQSARKS